MNIKVSEYKNGLNLFFLYKNYRVLLFTFFSFLLLCLFTNYINAQDTLRTNIDSSKTIVPKAISKNEKKAKKKTFREGYPSPKTAIKLAIIPGMGQIYNKKYWKLPLVYGALGGVIYSIHYNTREYKKTLQSLEAKNQDPNNEPLIIDPAPYNRGSISAVTAQRNIFDKNRQLSWIGVFGFYLISAGDAFVDAHLKDFSVDDNISFKPIIETDFNNQPYLGVGVTINLSK